MIMTIPRAILAGAGIGSSALIADAISQSTHIELGSAVAVVVVVASGAVWMGREFQKIQDRDKGVKEHLTAMEQNQIEWREEIRERFDALPCRKDVRGASYPVVCQPGEGGSTKKP